MIGVTNAKDQAEGIGFFIPINDVKSIIEELINNGRTGRPILGVTVVTIDQATASSSLADGLFVRDVTEGDRIGGSSLVSSHTNDRVETMTRRDP